MQKLQTVFVAPPFFRPFLDAELDIVRSPGKANILIYVLHTTSVRIADRYREKSKQFAHRNKWQNHNFRRYFRSFLENRHFICVSMLHRKSLSWFVDGMIRCVRIEQCDVKLCHDLLQGYNYSDIDFIVVVFFCVCRISPYLL